MDDLSESDLNRQFESALARFVNKELNEKNKDKNGSNNKNDLNNEVDNAKEITKYFVEEKDFKQKLIKKAKKLYELDKEVQGNCKSLMNKILKNIDKDSLDIVSCLFNYIRDKIYHKYFIYIFRALEDNNFFSTLVENKKDNNKYLIENITEIKEQLLDKIGLNKDIYVEDEDEYSFSKDFRKKKYESSDESSFDEKSDKDDDDDDVSL